MLSVHVFETKRCDIELNLQFVSNLRSIFNMISSFKEIDIMANYIFWRSKKTCRVIISSRYIMLEKQEEKRILNDKVADYFFIGFSAFRFL